MTDSPSLESERQRIGEELRRIAADNGLDSIVKIAEAIGMQRRLVGRVLRGDTGVGKQKLETVESRIRNLHHEMGSDYDDLPRVGRLPRVVRGKTRNGTEFVYEADPDDTTFEELQNAILALVKRAESEGL